MGGRGAGVCGTLRVCVSVTLRVWMCWDAGVTGTVRRHGSEMGACPTVGVCGQRPGGAVGGIRRCCGALPGNAAGAYSMWLRAGGMIPVVLYHGTPAERAEMRRTVMRMPEGWPRAAAPAPAASASANSNATTHAEKKRGRPAKGSKSTDKDKTKLAPIFQSAQNANNAKKKKEAVVPASPVRRSGRNAQRSGEAAAAEASTSVSAPVRGGRGAGRGGRGAGRGRGGGTAPVVGMTAGAKRKRGDVDDSSDEHDELDEDSDEEDDDANEGRDDDENEHADEKPKNKKATAAQKKAQALDDAHDAHFAAFPVVTTYDLIIRDRPVLGGIPWGYIVVDEGHRLKNMHCALMREVKRYSSAGRMVLTGTPLHNNLAELWSLLNFILPDIFDDVDAFQEWFSLPRMSALLPSARMGTFISTLHTILKPFLLRRMKADVLAALRLLLFFHPSSKSTVLTPLPTGSALPPKKSYVLYARLSARQHEAYEAVLKGEVRALVAGGMGASSASASTSASASAAATSPLASGSGKQEEVASAKQEDEGRTLRTRKRRHGKGKGREDDAEREAEEEAERRRAAEAFAKRGKAKHVNNMKLQNTVMQLRKVCSHPFLFARPDDDKWSLGRAPVTPELLAAREAELVGASGKMLLLDRLLGELFRRGHKVLLFSQFTTMLDIIEDWAVDMKGWKICRIDGTTPPLERRDQMNVFQSAGDAPVLLAPGSQFAAMRRKEGDLGCGGESELEVEREEERRVEAEVQEEGAVLTVLLVLLEVLLREDDVEVEAEEKEEEPNESHEPARESVEAAGDAGAGTDCDEEGAV
ncbi:SNF2 family N-terminal domain-containing protein [Mycena alexandri]|uniref:SNF2 family N-terminal domain-containing protein n=1 Tax=Mycena alexandri TaxID=1745969 RepID=A0AAD6RVI3_9AGAR|nr:SNF2 family N-terminal domain-containing protein [Mycena alexandri]